MELRLPIGKFPLFDGFAHFCHDDLVEVQVVDGVELCAQNFADTVQMVQVGAAEILTGVAGTAFIRKKLYPKRPGLYCFSSSLRIVGFLYFLSAVHVLPMYMLRHIKL